MEEEGEVAAPVEEGAVAALVDEEVEAVTVEEEGAAASKEERRGGDGRWWGDGVREREERGRGTDRGGGGRCGPELRSPRA